MWVDFKNFRMKYMLLFLSLLSVQCGKEKIERNPYLADVSFQIEINTNLPQYDALRYAGGALRVVQGGIKGVIVFNVNGNQYLAWEASCPNHIPKNCSQMGIKGVLAECSCESYRYSLATGQLLNTDSGLSPPYPLLNYRIENYGNTLRISN
jgi:nitrite reductase/ring-hydroxylating ferredoxin subunit